MQLTRNDLVDVIDVLDKLNAATSRDIQLDTSSVIFLRNGKGELVGEVRFDSEINRFVFDGDI